MPSFTLGNCRVELTIAPLTGPLEPVERQFAWLLYLELVARPALRDDVPAVSELADLIARCRELLAAWPAARLEGPTAGQLGYVVLAAVEMVLLPGLRPSALTPPTWQAVRAFCEDFARDLARLYGFVEPMSELPADLRAAWKVQA